MTIKDGKNNVSLMVWLRAAIHLGEFETCFDISWKSVNLNIKCVGGRVFFILAIIMVKRGSVKNESA